MPVPRVLKQSVGYHMFRLHRLMHASFEARLQRLGVTPAQWAMLSMLNEGEKTPAQIAKQMQMDRAAVLRTSERLMACKLIKKIAKSGAQRSFHLCLTPKGKSLFPKILAESAAVNQEFLSDLSAEERKLLLSLLIRLKPKTV